VTRQQGWTCCPTWSQNTAPALLHPPLRTLISLTNMDQVLCCKTTALGGHDTVLPSLLMFGAEETQEK